MPIEYTISLEMNLTLFRWKGDVEISEFRDVFEVYLQDENYVFERPEICDFSGVTHLDADFNRIWSVLTMINAQAEGRKVNTTCVVYAPNETIYGLGRMFQSLAENANGVKVAVYRDVTEVMTHLGLAGGSLDALQQNGNFLPPRP